ncbi:MAG: hypothetical protein AB7S70_16065 [Hyphomicrobium sp.]|uniref:hypothetical protein n=1 Tax=Hyphomicrobium sp. TaxID=82 RepID=UPI003D0E08EC
MTSALDVPEVQFEHSGHDYLVCHYNGNEYRVEVADPDKPEFRLLKNRQGIGTLSSRDDVMLALAKALVPGE